MLGRVCAQLTVGYVDLPSKTLVYIMKFRVRVRVTTLLTMIFATHTLFIVLFLSDFTELVDIMI